MKLSRRTVILSALTFLILLLGLCGLSLLFAPDEEPEPIAAVQSTAAPSEDDADPAAVNTDPTPAPTRVRARVRSTDAAPTAAQPASASTETAEPTTRPTRTRAATATLLPTDAPTRTPRPTATPRPSSTPRPTATPLPPTPTTAPTATPLPLPTNTAAPTVPPPTATRSGVETAAVTNIVDGDTIDVNLNGAIVRVRYIGIDTPETGAVCGSEATQANAALVSGRTVTMVRDVSETDRFGRLLRYVYVGDTFVNGELVAGGWADAVDYPPDTAQAGLLHSLAAAGVGRGCDLVAAPLPTQPAPEPTAPPQGGNCDPSYPDVCIPPAPPDLDCKDVPYRRFRVLPPDPHNFDGNHDGVGCES